jgi:tetratricopeptide (TPR) repeat protein
MRDAQPSEIMRSSGAHPRRIALAAAALVLLGLAGLPGTAPAAGAQSSPSPFGNDGVQVQADPDTAFRDQLAAALRQRALVHIERGRLQWARDTLARLAALTPEDPWPQATWARLRLRQFVTSVLPQASVGGAALKRQAGDFARQLLDMTERLTAANESDIAAARLRVDVAVAALTLLGNDPLTAAVAELRRRLEAVGALPEATAAAPPAQAVDHRPALQALGEAEVRLGNARAAAVIFAGLVALSPETMPAAAALHALLAGGAVTAADIPFTSAREVHTALVNHGDSSQPRRAAAWAVIEADLEAGDVDGAAAVVATARERFPDMTLMLADRVLAAAAAGNLAQPQRIIDLLKISPFFWNDIIDVSRARRLLDELGDGPGSAEVGALLAAMQLDDEPRDSEVCETALQLLDRFVAAVDPEAAAVEVLASAPRLLRDYAWAALRTGRPDCASAYERLIAEVGADPDARVSHRWRLRLETARFVQTHSIDASAAFRYQMALEGHNGDADAQSDARADLAAALQIAPDFGLAHRLRAELAFNRDDDYDAALTHYRAAAKTLPDDLQVKRGLAFAAFFAADGAHLAEARERFAELAESAPDDPAHADFVTLIDDIQADRVKHGAFVAFFHGANADTRVEADDWLDLAEQRQPQLYETALARGQVRLQEALGRMSASVLDDGGRSRAEAAAGFELAVTSFAEAAEWARRPGQRAAALVFLARAHYFAPPPDRDRAGARRKQLAAARDALVEARRIAPTNTGAALLLGEVELAGGDLVAAHRVYRDLLLTTPEAPIFAAPRDPVDNEAPPLSLPAVPETAGGEGEGVDIRPRLEAGFAARFSATVQLAGRPDRRGLPMPPTSVGVMVDLRVTDVIAPGMADLELRLLRAEGPAWFDRLVDVPIRLTVSSVFGLTDYAAPLPEAFAERRGEAEAFRAAANDLRALLVPALVEALVYAPGRKSTAVGERWSKHETAGVLHLTGQIDWREASVLAAVDRDGDGPGIARIEREATRGNRRYGDLGRLRSELLVDLGTGEPVALTLRFRDLVQDASSDPSDVAETTTQIRLRRVAADGTADGDG